MTIGRLSISKGFGSTFGFIQGACKCKIFYSPIVMIVWVDPNCKCEACGKYECYCE